jgi:hypothetical protein
MSLNDRFKPVLQGEWLLTRDGKSRASERVLINGRIMTRYGSPGKAPSGIWNGEWRVVSDWRGPESFSLVFTVSHFEMGSVVDNLNIAHDMLAFLPMMQVNKLAMGLGRATMKHIENKENAAIRAGRQWHYPLVNYSDTAIRMFAGRRWQQPEGNETTYVWTMTKKTT